MPCPGYVAIFIPMVLIAFLLTVVFVAEFLRRERTTTKEDDWVQFHKHPVNDDDPETPPNQA